MSAASAGVGDPDRAVDRDPDPQRFAGILEARGEQPGQARLRRGFLSLVGIKAGMRVLDVGCGHYYGVVGVRA